MEKANKYKYLLHLGDQSMILGHRLSELCGHGPSLETDIALTNISLDLFGQVRNFFQYAAEIGTEEETEDSIAFLRLEREYCSSVLLEQPNTDFAHVIIRQYLFDVFQLMQLEFLIESSDSRIAAICHKAIKETKYHKRFSEAWVIRLGLGTETSNQKMQDALNNLYPFCSELLKATQIEIEADQESYGINPEKFSDAYYSEIKQTFNSAGLQIEDTPQRMVNGKTGIHSEHMGPILSSLQYMQRTYPNMQW